MTDTTLELNLGSGGNTLAIDNDVTTGDHQYIKLKFGGSNTFTHVTGSVGLPVNIVQQGLSPIVVGDGGGSLTIDGTVTASAANDNSNFVSIGDGSNSATIRNLAANDALNVSVVDASGNQITSFGSTGGTSAVDDAAFTAATDSGTPMMGFATADTVNSGDVGVLRMTTARLLEVSIAENQLDSSTNTDDAAYTAGTGFVTVLGGFATSDVVDSGDVGALAMDTNRALKVILQANSGVDIGDVDVTSISAGSNLIGDVGLSGARTSGGTTIFRSIDLDETEEEIKATAGQLYWLHAMNLAATKRYLKFYNATAATVVVGTTTPVLTFPLLTQGDTNGAGFNLAIPNGIAFGTAITAAATTGIADADTGAPGANEVILNCGYA